MHGTLLVWAQDFSLSLCVPHSELRYLLPSWQFPLSGMKDKSENWRSLEKWDCLEVGWKQRGRWSQTIQDKALIPGVLKERELGELVARTTWSWGKGGRGKEMGDLQLLLLLPLSLAAFHGVKGCLECDPKFIKDIKSLLVKLVPSEVPGWAHLLERQIKKMICLSFKISHSDKMLRVLGEESSSPWEFGGLKGEGR